MARDTDTTFSIRAQIFDAFVAEAARMEKIKNTVGCGASEFVQTRPSSVGWPDSRAMCCLEVSPTENPGSGFPKCPGLYFGWHPDFLDVATWNGLV